MTRLAIAALAALLPALAAAEPEEFATEWSNYRVVACDTQEQVTDLLDVWRDHGFQSHLQLYSAFNAMRNAIGEPVCGVVTGAMRGVAQHTVYAGLEAPPDTDYSDAYLIEVETADRRTLYVWTPFPLALPGQPI